MSKGFYHPIDRLEIKKFQQAFATNSMRRTLKTVESAMLKEGQNNRKKPNSFHFVWSEKKIIKVSQELPFSSWKLFHFPFPTTLSFVTLKRLALCISALDSFFDIAQIWYWINNKKRKKMAAVSRGLILLFMGRKKTPRLGNFAGIYCWCVVFHAFANTVCVIVQMAKVVALGENFGIYKLIVRFSLGYGI